MMSATATVRGTPSTVIAAALTADDRQMTSVRIAAVVATPVTPAIVAVTPSSPKPEADGDGWVWISVVIRVRGVGGRR